MIFMDHSTYDASNIDGNLGVSEYSYWFVRKAFRPVLERFGTVIPVRNPDKEADAFFTSFKRQGISSLFFSFNPPHHMPLGLSCPTIPVFAWEYNTIPAQVWHGEERNNWAGMLRAAPCAITHSTASVAAVLSGTGSDYPIWSIPAPIFESKKKYVEGACGWHEGRRLSLSTGLVFDTWELDLGVFSPERPSKHGTHVLDLIHSATKGVLCPVKNITLEGVIYSSVFNPADGRKNWEDLVSAFVWAFRQQGKATLILKLAHWSLEEGVRPVLAHIAQLGNFKCRILVVQGMLSEQDYEQVLEATSFTVNTSTGEGQCLPLMEFMAAGRPAIAPRHTAMIDYVDETNSFVVACHERPAFWPHDARHAITCRRHQTSFTDIVRCYRDSFRIASCAPQKYREMSLSACEAQRRYCSMEVVSARLQAVIETVVKQNTDQ